VAKRLNENAPKGVMGLQNAEDLIQWAKEDYKNENQPTETSNQSNTATVEIAQDIPSDVNNETEINEDDIVLPDDTIDLINSLEDETTQSNNTGTDGNAEPGTEIIQQSEQSGQENLQGVSPTADGTGGQ